jgi:hypothetical protein
MEDGGLKKEKSCKGKNPATEKTFGPNLHSILKYLSNGKISNQKCCKMNYPGSWKNLKSRDFFSWRRV